jgi:hypothetical protein
MRPNRALQKKQGSSQNIIGAVLIIFITEKSCEEARSCPSD